MFCSQVNKRKTTFSKRIGALSTSRPMNITCFIIYVHYVMKFFTNKYNVTAAVTWFNW